MAKRKSKKSKSRRKPSLLALKDRRKKKTKGNRQSLKTLLMVLGLVTLVGAVSVMLVILEQYVGDKKNLDEKTALLKLVEPPLWLNESLKRKIYSAAIAGDEDLKLDNEAAASVQQNLATFVPWFENVEVRATNESLLIEASWRTPVALIEAGSNKVYVDANLVVLDYVPMEKLPIISITGLRRARPPKPAVVWEKDDLAAAIEILKLLIDRDKLYGPEKPLLLEIKDIDVTNFNGRENRNKPHIILHATDDTEIVWGAEVGKSTQLLEVPYNEKLIRLYSYYHQHQTLLGTAPKIVLCEPADYVPQPIDDF